MITNVIGYNRIQLVASTKINWLHICNQLILVVLTITIGYEGSC